MRIDAHHHFWKYDPVEYDWISDEMSVIRRDFLPADLQAEIRATGIDGVVSVQARQIVQETAWLLDFAQVNDFIKGVVGWVPLVSRTVAADLARFAENPKLRAVRHVLQGEADERYMLRPDFNAGIRSLKQFDLAYDILIFERHLPQTIEFVDQHPAQIFVLDHVAKPRIKEGVIEPWKKTSANWRSGITSSASSPEWSRKRTGPCGRTRRSGHLPRPCWRASARTA